MDDTVTISRYEYEVLLSAKRGVDAMLLAIKQQEHKQEHKK